MVASTITRVMMVVPEITQITQMKVDYLKNLTNVTTRMELKKQSVMQRYVLKIRITFHKEQKRSKNGLKEAFYNNF